MKSKYVVLTSAVVAVSVFFATKFMYQNNSYDKYLKSYTLENKLDMRIDDKEAIKLLKEGKAVVVDVRFPVEQEKMNLGFGYMIPLNEPPDRINELPKDKLIITGCLGNERGNMARIYLLQHGFNAKHLYKGISGLNDALTEADKQFLKNQK